MWSCPRVQHLSHKHCLYVRIIFRISSEDVMANLLCQFMYSCMSATNRWGTRLRHALHVLHS
jgi:hypothetical protein